MNLDPSERWFRETTIRIESRIDDVMRVLPREMLEAEELLEEVRSWSEEEIEELPKFYREKARELRQRELTQQGEE